MNFSVRQWILSIVLDMTIKIVPITFLGVLMTLSAAPVASFVCLAVSLSIFHFICLFFGNSLAAAFELVRVKSTPRASFGLARSSANIMFAVSLAAFFALTENSKNIPPPSFSRYLIIWGGFAVTNLIPILLVAGGSRVFRRLGWSR